MDESSQKLIEESKSILFEFSIQNDLTMALVINGYVALFALVLLLIVLLYKVFTSTKITSMELDEATFGIGSHKIKLKPNKVDSQIAYKIWVELSTRKIGIPVDIEKDVIVEVYNSWYQFFGITRELIKEIPASKLKRLETRNIVQLSIDILNLGVRPHLTTWQARFRHWYDVELTKTSTNELTPQEIQKEFPNYASLTDDLLAINNQLIEYRKAMYQLAIGSNS